MIRMFRAGFVRHFLSGFALGAVGLVGFQVASTDGQPVYQPVARTDTQARVS